MELASIWSTRADNVDLAVPACLEQRCVPVLTCQVHRRTCIEQQLDSVGVAELAGHIDRCGAAVRVAPAKQPLDVGRMAGEQLFEVACIAMAAGNTRHSF